jgi:hypothetical protein
LGIGWLICACASCSVFEHADCKVLWWGRLHTVVSDRCKKSLFWYVIPILLSALEDASQRWLILLLDR